ncbi:ArsR/SmtB family transcription factor [Denitrobaculum tricleocarpae]|uniref:Metalloregulator ArsR/SmtB family transcription factor n=1 Tax=Denitrobaculum tricleocarpae TaxID=2591009 RepID=A0A545TUN0_9PROT|nr:metalloregulator ArsR/SmtB family transcription factor [Denitrobaculum tricleocarpae]TQV80916.1 metalloregulator ArsR/SmtB family transcription factor [Denitrobaculum tricleocarpae]
MIGLSSGPSPGEVQGAFRALADPTRRDILLLLSHQDMTIGEVVDRFDITRAAVKKHLTILEEGALISVHPSGRERINRLEPLGLKSVTDWLNHFNQFWDERLQALQIAVEQEEKKKAKKK